MNTSISPFQRTVYSVVAWFASMGLLLAGNNSIASLTSSQAPVGPLTVGPLTPQDSDLTIASTSPKSSFAVPDLVFETASFSTTSIAHTTASESDLELPPASRTVSNASLFDPALSLPSTTETMESGDLDTAYWNLGTRDVLLQRVSKDYQSEAWDEERQQAAQNRILEQQPPRSADEVNGALRHLRKRPTVRGAFDLINPFAPLPTPALAVMEAETRRPLVQPNTRVFHDAVWHEGGLRLW